MSTATDQLVLRKHIPMKMIPKATSRWFLQRNMPPTKKGMLTKRLTPQMTGSIHSYFGLRYLDINIPAVTPIKPPNRVTAPKYMVISSLVMGPHIPIGVV